MNMLASLNSIPQDLLAMSAIGSVCLLNGNVYRVCAGSVVSVRAATVKALNRMRIKVATIGQVDEDNIIFAMTGERKIEVWVKALSDETVQLGISARQDGAEDIRTAAEVIAQTEQLLAHSPA